MGKIIFLMLISLYSCEDSNDKKNDYNHYENEFKVSKVDLVNERGDSSFINFWDEFSTIVASSQYDSFKQISFDSLSCQHQFISLSDFFMTYYEKVFDKELINNISQKKGIEFLDDKIDKKYLPGFLVKEIKAEKISKKLVNIKKSSKILKDSFIIIVLEFIKTEKGYKFSGYDKFGS